MNDFESQMISMVSSIEKSVATLSNEVSNHKEKITSHTSDIKDLHEYKNSTQGSIDVFKWLAGGSGFIGIILLVLEIIKALHS